MLFPAQTLDVYAAASLREAFTSIAHSFEATHPGVKVRLNFAGSQTLAAQIANGAPADLFASASAKNLQGLAYDPKTRRVFATNQLVVIGGPTLKDLAKAKRIVLAGPTVPAGDYARKALAAAAKTYGAAWLQTVQSHVVSQEADVRAVLTKVRLGEADAGIVYASDGKGNPIPTKFQPVIQYPLIVPQDAPNPALARQFADLVLSKTGRAALKKQGFGLP